MSPSLLSLKSRAVPAFPFSKFGAMCQNCKCSTWRYSVVIQLFSPSFSLAGFVVEMKTLIFSFIVVLESRVCLALLEMTKVTENTELKSSLNPGWFFHLCPEEWLNSLSLEFIYFFFNQLFCPACSLFLFCGIFTANLPVLEGSFLSKSLIYLSQLWLLQWEMQECFSGTELLSCLLEVFTQSLRKGNPVKITSGDVRGN